MTQLPAVILAGGLARRMGGGDKGLLTLGHQPILSDLAAKLGATAIVTVSADTPFFPRDLAQTLTASAAREWHAFALAATPEPERGSVRHPTFGLWPTALRDDLRAALNDGVRKVVAWTDRHGAATALFDTSDIDPFFNVNTPEDLTLARSLLATAP